MALPPPITVSQAAVSRVQQLLEQRGKPSAGVRVGVRSGGCSGLSYTIEYADEVNPYDEVVTVQPQQVEGHQEELKILIDPKAIMYLIGTEMDFVEEKMKSGFVFHNPNEKGRCGCGESFNV
jgi:iron-sulfur cluster assembly protein